MLVIREKFSGKCTLQNMTKMSILISCFHDIKKETQKPQRKDLLSKTMTLHMFSLWFELSGLLRKTQKITIQGVS